MLAGMEIGDWPKRDRKSEHEDGKKVQASESREQEQRLNVLTHTGMVVCSLRDFDLKPMLLHNLSCARCTSTPLFASGMLSGAQNEARLLTIDGCSLDTTHRARPLCPAEAPVWTVQ